MRGLGGVMLALLSTGIFSAPVRAGQPDGGPLEFFFNVQLFEDGV